MYSLILPEIPDVIEKTHVNLNIKLANIAT